MTEKAYNFQPIEFDPFAGPEIERVVPVTEPQLEILASCLIGGEEANRSYNESVSLYLEGPLQYSVLERSVREIVSRHDALRSGFSADSKQLCVFKDLAPQYIFQDISQNDPELRDKLINDFLVSDATTAFDLIDGPLFRVNLFRLAENKHHLTLSAHHIICDGWSIGVIMQDLSKIYSSYVRNELPQLEAAPSFAEYAVRQKQFYASTEYHSIEQYWLSQYKDNVPVVDVPTDQPRPEIKTYKSQRDDYILDPDLVEGIRKMGAQTGCSFVTTMLVAFEVFLHKITGQDDIVLGIPSAGQSSEGNYGLVGHCVNMLPVRSHHTDSLTFADFLRQRKPAIFDAYENQQFTFGSMLQKMGMSRDSSRVPLIPVVFNIDIGLDDGVKFEGIAHDLVINKREYENFEIFLNASGSDNSLTLEWSYNTSLFSADTIRRMMEDFESLLQAIVKTPEIKIRDIPMKASEDLNRSYDRWNNTKAPYPEDKPLHQLFEEQAEANPQRTAFKYKDESYTYKELNEEANRLASLLVENGAGKGEFIALALDRSSEMLIAMLAILKSGAAYIPVDPNYPKKRIEFMLSDSSAKLLVTTKRHTGKFSSSIREILLDDHKDTLQKHSPRNLNTDVKGNDLAYLIYTSGSSGKPKGTQIEHHSVVNFLNSMQRSPGIAPEDRLLAVTTISFDIAGLELYLPLISGAELVIADDDAAKDGRILSDLIRSEKISIMQATPSTWRMMTDAGWDSKLNIKILCGGEALPYDLATKLLSLGREVWNMYGPTETTIWSAIKQIKSDEQITLGHPIDNTRIYILDKTLRPVMPGLSGAIYIAGEGLARGYLNQPELTTASFIADPFSENKKERIYNTGDLGKFNAQGEIIYLGRADTQVKMRGYRIEPGAIEHSLNALKGVKDSVVIAREDTPGDQRLVAYVVPVEDIDKSASWQERWEDLYKRGIQSESDLDINEQQLDIAVAQQISGRNDIKGEVEEWLEQSVSRIKELKAKNVIELGCGAGQLIFPIAPLTENFIATDYAQTAIDKLNEKLAADPEKWKNVNAFVAPADDFSSVRRASLDLVIINGVVQYFPDAAYLIKVIEESSKALRDGGCIYIGDMQGKSALPMYHAFDQLSRSVNEQSVTDFKKIVDRRIKLEDELVADPQFFYLLPEIIPQITSVEVQLREGIHLNETTKYHYDIWLYVKGGPEIAASEINIEWGPEQGIDWISNELDKYPGSVVALKNIYNSRTAEDHSLQEALKLISDVSRIKELKDKLKPEKGADPHEFWQLGRDKGFKSHIRWSSDGSDGLFEVIFMPPTRADAIPGPADADKPDAESIFDYINNPSSGNISVSAEQSASWKQGLAETLPSYMVPSDFVLIKKIPLLPNGKTDRKALPRPEQKTEAHTDINLPETEAERIVVKVWSDVLGLSSVNTADDFFELGGHSLIAVQVMIRMEKETGIRLPLTTLFRHSTVEQFALLFAPDQA